MVTIIIWFMIIVSGCHFNDFVIFCLLLHDLVDVSGFDYRLLSFLIIRASVGLSWAWFLGHPILGFGFVWDTEITHVILAYTLSKIIWCCKTNAHKDCKVKK